MEKTAILQDLEKQLQDIEADIQHYQEAIEQYPSDARREYQNKLKRLYKRKHRLLVMVEKYQLGKNSFIDNIIATMNAYMNNFQRKSRCAFLEKEIKERDEKMLHDFLEKHQQDEADYSFDIEIQQMENAKKQMVATRCITITNTKTNKVKKYSAGGETKQQWEIEFDQDLKHGYFA